jgi:hypothetical protein
MLIWRARVKIINNPDMNHNSMAPWIFLTSSGLNMAIIMLKPARKRLNTAVLRNLRKYLSIWVLKYVSKKYI